MNTPVFLSRKEFLRQWREDAHHSDLNKHGAAQVFKHSPTKPERRIHYLLHGFLEFKKTHAIIHHN